MPKPPPTIRVSARARRYVERHGGVLYVWVSAKSEGSGLGWLMAATAAPEEVDFVEITVDGLPVRVQRGLRATLGRKVKVRLWRIPKEALDVSGAVVVDL